jgi:putative DNA primase/helicase
MNVRSIAAALGGEAVGRDQVLCPGPGHSREDRSLSVRFISADDFVVHSFAGDDPILCKDYVRQRLGLPQWQPGDDNHNRSIPQHKVAAWDRAVIDREPEEHRQLTEDDLLRIERAVAIWNEAQHPRGTLAERYLQEQRKLYLPADVANTVLRFHPRCPWRNENTGKTDRVSALIAAFRSVDDDKITAIHRIALNPDGTKIGRRMLGVAHRVAVKLDSIIGDELAIGEGIETCMAAREIGGMPPVWALGSVGAISFFPILPGIRRLTILGEAGEASVQAIKACGTRWHRAGRRVRIAMPSVGSDFNDQLMGTAI